MLKKHETMIMDSNNKNKRTIPSSSDLNLNAQNFRIQSLKCIKSISYLWNLSEAEIIQFFQEYSSLPCTQTKPSQIYQLKSSKLIKLEEKVYLGQISGKKKHGKGISIHKDGRIYEGQFQKNEKSGFGVQIYSNGNLYIGNFSRNKKHGKGSLYWFSLCKNNQKLQQHHQIEQYHGEWWGGLPDGKGQHLKTNGDHYVGIFKNGLKHGDGIEKYGNGDKYEGQYVNGLAEGYGEYTWADGSVYRGDFKQGYRNGYGMWKTKNESQKYKGHYILDRKHGYGVYEWSTGQMYKGTYLEDKRQGQGQLYINGQIYFKGLWQNGKQLQNEFGPSQPQPFPSKTLNKVYKRNFASQNLQEPKKQINKDSMSFRVKTSKPKYQTPAKRQQSATSIRSAYNVKFHNTTSTASNLSVHRGCVACKKRPIPGQYGWKKLANNNNNSNPQQSFV